MFIVVSKRHNYAYRPVGSVVYHSREDAERARRKLAHPDNFEVLPLGSVYE